MQWENGTHFPHKEGTWKFSKHVIDCKLWSFCPNSRKSIITGFQDLGNVPDLDVTAFNLKGQVWSKKVFLDATLKLSGSVERGEIRPIASFPRREEPGTGNANTNEHKVGLLHTFTDCSETVLSPMQ